MNHLNNNKLSNAMIGNGENSVFVKKKTGSKVMIGEGNISIFVESGITLKKSRQKLEDRMDDALYSKTVAFIKKMKRKINNKI